MTHLVELLRAADPAHHEFSRITVWASHATARLLPERFWLEVRAMPDLDRALPRRLWWQRFRFAGEARRAGCDLVFAPGGRFGGDFHPVVTMCRNMLPFDADAARRYGVSWMRLKIALLRRAQMGTFRRAEGVIFLTDGARQRVEADTGPLPGRTRVIPHGILAGAFRRPETQRAAFTPAQPCRLLYVSTVDAYKNQWVVIRAAAQLRRAGVPVHLTLIGDAERAPLRRLEQAVNDVDPRREFVAYVGPVSHAALPRRYHAADVFVFASACENLPNILLEAMAASLPIACSRLSVMPEVAGDAVVYFDPDDPASIAGAVRQLIDDPRLREAKAHAGHARAQEFSWERCAAETFRFLADVAMSPSRARE